MSPGGSARHFALTSQSEGACFLWEDRSGDMTPISISSYRVVLIFREFSQIITSWVLMQQSQHCSTSTSFCEGAVFRRILPDPLCIYVAGLIPFTSHAEMFFSFFIYWVLSIRCISAAAQYTQRGSNINFEYAVPSRGVSLIITNPYGQERTSSIDFSPRHLAPISIARVLYRISGYSICTY